MIKLRWYQQEAVDAAWDWIRKCYDPCCLELCTAAGKSFILAALAERVTKASGKKVLVLGPNKEICEQNYSKYLLTGEPASIYSASVGRKETKHNVVFGSPLTVINDISKFNNYAAVFIDECHILSSSVKNIISEMRKTNGKLRVVGVTATPYRTGTGYIYENHYKDGLCGDDESIDPYFKMLVYSIEPRLLIANGFLTQPVVGLVSDTYDTSSLEMDKKGRWIQSTVDVAFVGRGRKTSLIIRDIVEKSSKRNCVMIFASTRQHASEIMESLPAEISRIVTGETKKKDREKIIKQANKGSIKYLVSVGALTTGVDIPRVDVIAMMRATESASLFQQIIGRALRLFDGKNDAVILDYAENIERFFPHGDLFAPEIKARRALKGEPMQICCPSCGHENQFSARPNPDGFEIDAEGFFIDASRNRIETGIEGVFMPAHYGRRCQGFKVSKGHAEQCSYKWAFKTCEACGHENDIAARYCGKCKAELVDPNERLLLEAIKLEKDPYRVRMANVQMWRFKRWPGKDGKPDSLRVEYMIDEKPSTLLEWYHPESANTWLFNRWQSFCMKSFGEALPDLQSALDMQHDAAQPEKIAFKKKANSKYFDIVGLEWSKQE